MEVAVSVGVADTLIVAEAVLLAVAVVVPDGEGVEEVVALALAVIDAVNDAVTVTDGVALTLAVAVSVGVAVVVAVDVALTLAVAVSVPDEEGVDEVVALALAVIDAVNDAEAVIDGVALTLAVAVSAALGVIVAVALTLGVALEVALLLGVVVCVPVSVAVTLEVALTEPVSDAVGVTVAVPVGEPVFEVVGVKLGRVGRIEPLLEMLAPDEMVLVFEVVLVRVLVPVSLAVCDAVGGSELETEGDAPELSVPEGEGEELKDADGDADTLAEELSVASCSCRWLAALCWGGAAAPALASATSTATSHHQSRMTPGPNSNAGQERAQLETRGWARPRAQRQRWRPPVSGERRAFLFCFSFFGWPERTNGSRLAPPHRRVCDIDGGRQRGRRRTTAHRPRRAHGHVAPSSRPLPRPPQHLQQLGLFRAHRRLVAVLPAASA